MATKKKVAVRVKKMGNGGSPKDTTKYKNRNFDPRGEKTSPPMGKKVVKSVTKIKRKAI